MLAVFVETFTLVKSSIKKPFMDHDDHATKLIMELRYDLILYIMRSCFEIKLDILKINTLGGSFGCWLELSVMQVGISNAEFSYAGISNVGVSYAELGYVGITNA